MDHLHGKYSAILVYKYTWEVMKADVARELPAWIRLCTKTKLCNRGEWGTFSHGAHSFFFAICGKTSVVRPQCKSAEYYFHHPPSFAVEISIIFVTTSYKFNKCILRGSSKLYSNHPFSWFLLEIGEHFFQIHHKEAPSLHGAAANLSMKSVWFFKNKFGNIFK